MSDTGYPTFIQPNTDASNFNEMAFVFQQLMGAIVTSTLVKVVAVTPGEDLKIGTVDVQPCVNQVDSTQTGTPHGTIYKLPYSRVQAGDVAVIVDPQVGDIGWAGFCHRDISTVKNTMAVANPGSRRRYDWADGVYLFGVLPQKAPTTYIRLTDSGITIVSTSVINVTAGGDVTIDCGGNNLDVTNVDTMNVDGEVKITGNCLAAAFGPSS